MSSPIEASHVFEPEYWDNPREPLLEYRPKGNHVPDEARQTELAKVIPNILMGKTEPLSVGKGVIFNPSDPEIAWSSPINYPGSVLVVDSETMMSLDQINSARAKRFPSEPVDPDLLGSNALDLLRSRMVQTNGAAVFTPDIPTRISSGEIAYANSHYAYTRIASFIFIAMSNRHQLQARPMLQGMATINREGEASVSGIILGGTLIQSGAVDYSHIRYARKKFQMAARIRSLLLCASGEDVFEKPKRLRIASFGNFSN
jgi:hypothetical protein